MLETRLTALAVQDALNRPSLEGGFYGDRKSLALVERAVEIGVVNRYSTTQAGWANEDSYRELSEYIVHLIEENKGDYPMVQYEGRKYRIVYRREIEIEAVSLEEAQTTFENLSKEVTDSFSSYVEMTSIEEI